MHNIFPNLLKLKIHISKKFSKLQRKINMKKTKAKHIILSVLKTSMTEKNKSSQRNKDILHEEKKRQDERFVIRSNVSKKAMTPHSSTLAWKIPWTEEPGRLQSMGSLRVGHD